MKTFAEILSDRRRCKRVVIFSTKIFYGVDRFWLWTGLDLKGQIRMKERAAEISRFHLLSGVPFSFGTEPISLILFLPVKLEERDNAEKKSVRNQ
ncbi:hypothetical protein NGC32_06380 [Kluyvera cryocrescens]|uniref:hypothetical protein n=1 Tax=Kluyvera cryocrescens TaxID=580 RepID=UPI002DB88837|nr:hypothetical protein [Kluyvera cryocrescens]MEB7712352.1 hypothetical protein [Kluyvera cryocrescens]